MNMTFKNTISMSIPPSLVLQLTRYRVTNLACLLPIYTFGDNASISQYTGCIFHQSCGLYTNNLCITIAKSIYHLAYGQRHGRLLLIYIKRSPFIFLGIPAIMIC